MSRNGLAACVFGSLSLAGCHTVHSVRSISALAAPPEAACVEKVLKAQNDITDVTFEASESKTSNSSHWIYRTAGHRIWIQIRSTADGVTYINGLTKMGAPIPAGTAAALIPVITRVDTALIAECGLRPLSTLAVIHN